MGFLNWFKKSNRHVLTTEDIAKAAQLNSERFELRRQQMQLEAAVERLKLEKQKAALEAQINELSGGEPKQDSDLKILMSILGAAMASKQAGTVPAVPQVAAGVQSGEPPLIHLSDEQIEEVYQSLSKPALKMAKKLSDDQLKAIIIQKVGHIDEDTFNRAVDRLRK